MDQHIDHARTGHFDVDHAREQAAARRQVHRADAQLQVAVDYFGDVVDHPRRVAGHHADRHPERALRFVAPAGFEYPVGVVSAETLCVGAVRTVDRDAGTYGDEAEDFVAVDRIAAFGQFVVELSDLFVDDECVAAALGRNFFGFASFFRTRWLLLRPGALPPLRPTDGPEAAP